MFQVILYQPEIPPNTGNIIRLCANSGCKLHIIEPMAFHLDEKHLRRAGLDYHEWVSIKVHACLEDCIAKLGTDRVFAVSTKGKTTYTRTLFAENDAFLFGPETTGLPGDVLHHFSEGRILRIPMLEHSRSINLANAVSCLVYEAWRQLDFEGGL